MFKDKKTKKYLSCLIILLFLVLIFFSFSKNKIFDEKITNLANIISAVLIDLTNFSRKEIAKNELVINEQLVLAAQLKADDMAQKSYFSHTSPDGKKPWYWLKEVGYEYRNAGENLAVNFVDSEDVHNAWLNSPTHRANIFRDNFTEIGIATAEGYYKGRKAIFVVQLFGEPKTE
jgi:uncharacterized protein YkwD